MKWFKVTSWSDDITPVEVVRQTAKQLTIAAGSDGLRKREHTVAKECDSAQYFPTRCDAVEFIEARYERKIDALHAQLTDLQMRVATFRKRENL